MKIPTFLPWVVMVCLIVWKEYYLRKSKWILFTKISSINPRRDIHLPHPQIEENVEFVKPSASASFPNIILEGEEWGSI